MRVRPHTETYLHRAYSDYAAIGRWKGGGRVGIHPQTSAPRQGYNSLPCKTQNRSYRYGCLCLQTPRSKISASPHVLLQERRALQSAAASRVLHVQGAAASGDVPTAPVAPARRSKAPRGGVCTEAQILLSRCGSDRRAVRDVVVPGSHVSSGRYRLYSVCVLVGDKDGNDPVACTLDRKVLGQRPN